MLPQQVYANGAPRPTADANLPPVSMRTKLNSQTTGSWFLFAKVCQLELPLKLYARETVSKRFFYLCKGLCYWIYTTWLYSTYLSVEIRLGSLGVVVQQYSSLRQVSFRIVFAKFGFALWQLFLEDVYFVTCRLAVDVTRLDNCDHSIWVVEHSPFGSVLTFTIIYRGLVLKTGVSSVTS